jgi:recombination protein RecT
MAPKGNGAPAQGGQDTEPERKELSIRERYEGLEKFLIENKGKIENALGKWMAYDQLMLFVLNSVRRTPDLLYCTQASIFSAIMQSIMAGLPPDDFRGLAYLLPFWNEKKKRYECVFMPGYKGYIKLGRDSGEVVNVFSDIVYSNEFYKVERGLKPVLEHTPLPPDKRGDIIGAYTVLKLNEGAEDFCFMWKKDIEKIKARSKAKYGPWNTDVEWMMKKTTIRQVYKLHNLSPQIAAAVAIDEQVDAGLSPMLGDPDEIEVEALPGKPPVLMPQEKPVQDADSEKMLAISDYIAAMGWDLAEPKREIVNQFLKDAGVDAAFEYVKKEHRLWEYKGTNSATTEGTGAVGK